MIYLLFSILSSSLIFVIFKLFSTYKVNTLQAIIINYFIACSVGYIGYLKPENLTELPGKPWIFGSLCLGVLFISVFYLSAVTTQKSGLSVVSVATKMSVAIPVVFAIYYYREHPGIIKITGLVLALISVYLSSIKNKEGINIKTKNLLLPILVFFGSGIIDTTIKFLEEAYVNKNDVALFSTSIFAVAGSIGTCIILFQVFTGRFNFKIQTLMGGIALGVPNYYSIYFLVQALRTEGFESSIMFTINNVAIVLVSVILGILFFKEKLITKNWIGIGLAVLSIILIINSGKE